MRIGNKEYMQVNERIAEFRTNEKYSGYTLTTEILEHQDGFIMMKAIVKDATDRVIADGIAYEVNEADGMNKINLTSYIENCQTSAWGRALGNLGIGVDVSIASADEVKNAVQRQERVTETKQVVNTTQEKQFEKIWWDGQSPLKQFDHFMVGDLEYITMKNKDGQLFGLVTDKSITDPKVKYYPLQ